MNLAMLLQPQRSQQQPDTTTESNLRISEALAEMRKTSQYLSCFVDLLQARIERQ